MNKSRTEMSRNFTGLRWMLALLLSLCALAAQAQCTTSLPSTTAINFGNVPVPSSAPIGTVLATRTIPYTVSCSAAGGVRHSVVYEIPTSRSTAYSDVLATDNPGIGVRITRAASSTGMTSTNGNGPTSTPPYSANQTVAANTSTGAALSYSDTMKLELVKIAAGAITPGNLGTRSTFIRLDSNSTRVSRTVTDTGVVYSPACAVHSSVQTVTLDTISANDLSTVGAVAGTKAFNISLTCDGGMTLHTSFSDNTVPGNTTNVLTNNVSATQAGVGLQILRSGTPVNFGSDMTIISTSTNGTPVTIPLEARYIRRSGALTGGLVQGVFTYTLTYQ